MQSETKNCQNCKKDFIIDPEDFKFYEKIKVPPPTFCPECRLVRRLAWRNERSLFYAECDFCKKKIFSAYPAERSFPVFCHDCWFSDVWDPLSYGKNYNFSKPFFVQYKELFDTVPRLNLFQINSKNSQYANIIRDCKNVYLSYSVVDSEEVYFSKNIDRSRQIYDSLAINDCEKCAYLVYGANDYNVIYSVIVRDCFDSMFLYDCRNCSNCFMSANLRNQRYVFRGKKYTKEEYQTLIKEVKTGSYKEFKKIVEEFERMKQDAVHRFADIGKSVNSIGDALEDVKNVKESFEAYNMEDTKWTSRCFDLKDSYDGNYTGLKSELVYECISGGKNSKSIAFLVAPIDPMQDSYYSGWCAGSNLFGCFGVRSKSYCILNKQYTKEEYQEIIPKIIKHMSSMPYKGKNGRIYKYGEFFPVELSPFAYNESLVSEHFPLSREEIETKGYKYRENDKKIHKVTILPDNLPDEIENTNEDILKEIIGCVHAEKCLHQCTTAFRLNPEELSFYRNFKLPIPRLCPNCRHYKRLEYRKPWKLWHRFCMCDKNNHNHAGKCLNEFETSYAPDRPEIVYCERCYQAEVY